MDSINSLFGDTQKRLLAPPNKSRNTERGDLMDYFLSMLNPRRVAAGYQPYDHRRLGYMLQGIPTKDLYYIKSRCDMSRNWSATFHFILNPKKYKNNK